MQMKRVTMNYGRECKYKHKIEILCILISLFYSSNHNLCPKFHTLPSRTNISYGIIPKANQKRSQPTQSVRLFLQYVLLHLTRLFELRKSCWELCDSQKLRISQVSDLFVRKPLFLAKQHVVCDKTT